MNRLLQLLKIPRPAALRPRGNNQSETSVTDATAPGNWKFVVFVVANSGVQLDIDIGSNQKTVITSAEEKR